MDNNTKIFNVKLNNGRDMPIIGFGTFLSAKGEIGDAIKAAIECGYRHIDCAYVYNNEKEIGDALQELFQKKVVTREELFITSKLSASMMHPDEVQKGIKETLANLQVGYLDLYLVHIPVPIESVDGKTRPRKLNGYGLQDVWRKMEQCVDNGQTKSIGVSNYNVQTMLDVINYAKIQPVVNQVERHPYLPQNELLKFCMDNNVYLTGYGSLGSRGLESRAKKPDVVDLIESDVVKAIASAHGKTPAQVLLRWSVDTNVICIPKSVNPTRIKENFNIFDFKLTEKDLESLASLGHVGLRMFTQEWTGVPTFF
jgi:alcohol dehydrogenase (NADP+)